MLQQNLFKDMYCGQAFPAPVNTLSRAPLFTGGQLPSFSRVFHAPALSQHMQWMNPGILWQIKLLKKLFHLFTNSFNRDNFRNIIPVFYLSPHCIIYSFLFFFFFNIYTIKTQSCLLKSSWRKCSPLRLTE